MQVVDSVLIFRSSSIALQEISGVKIPTREGQDVNQQERKLSFLSAVFLFVLMSAVIAVFALTERADFIFCGDGACNLYYACSALCIVEVT